jgi:hypothetical protein
MYILIGPYGRVVLMKQTNIADPKTTIEIARYLIILPALVLQY